MHHMTCPNSLTPRDLRRWAGIGLEHENERKKVNNDPLPWGYSASYQLEIKAIQFAGGNCPPATSE